MLIKLDGRSEVLLEWYFSQTAFERSTSGASYERAESVRAGVLATNRARHERLASAYAQRKPSDPWDPDPVSARPTGGHGSNVGQEPNDEDLVRHAVATRCLEAVGRMPRGSRHYIVLGTYYGTPGTHFAEPAGVGLRPGQLPAALPQVFSLMHLTPQGKKLLEKAPSNALELPPYARMRVHCLMREGRKYKDLQPLFASAEQEAERWLLEVCEAWRASGAAAAVDEMHARRGGRRTRALGT